MIKLELKSLLKLFRLKPTVAWSLCGVLLGVSVAIHENGYGLNWDLILMSFIPVVLIQGIIAHAVNDITDEKVDRETNIKGTNRFKVLVSGIMSKDDLLVISIITLTLTSFISWYIFYRLGFMVFIFYSVGLYASLAYSLDPFKFGWKPFSEITIVLPVLVTLVVAINYISTGFFSLLSIIVGIVFAIFNMIWFIISRMMDYYPDMRFGKNTTAVYLGLQLTSNYILAIFAILFVYVFFLFAVKDIDVFGVPYVMSIVYLIVLPGLGGAVFSYESNEKSISSLMSKYRLRGIIVSTLNSVFMSAYLIAS